MELFRVATAFLIGIVSGFGTSLALKMATGDSLSFTMRLIVVVVTIVVCGLAYSFMLSRNRRK